MFSVIDIILIGLLVLSASLIGAFIGYLYGKDSNSSYVNVSKEINKKEQVDRKSNVVGTEKEDSHHIRQSITNKMEMLKGRTEVDFLGLGVYDVMAEEIRWRVAVGAKNTRYKRIVIRMGKGIAGEAIQLNRTIKIEDYPNDVLGDPIEYPILLVEQLRSVIAVPVANEERVYGVLLIGQRHKRTFTDEDEYITKIIAQEIARELELGNIYSRILHETPGKNEEISENINDSSFVTYLIEQQEQIKNSGRGKLNFEVLDQSIVEIQDYIQENLTINMQEILDIVNQKDIDITNVSIQRDETNLLVECKINRSIPSTKEVFENIYYRIDEVGGSIISYHDKDCLHLAMQIPIWGNKKTLLI